MENREKVIHLSDYMVKSTSEPVQRKILDPKEIRQQMTKGYWSMIATTQS